jgi:hypothetical protein
MQQHDTERGMKRNFLLGAVRARREAIAEEQHGSRFFQEA